MKHAVGDDARNTRSSSLALPILGVAIAIAGTTTIDATGLSDFSAFALLPLIFLFWYIDRLSRSEMGFRTGKPTHFALALLYPLLVIGLIAIVAAFAGVVDLSKTNFQKAFLNLLIVTISTALVAIVTEEGFFEVDCGDHWCGEVSLNRALELRSTRAQPSRPACHKTPIAKIPDAQLSAPTGNCAPSFPAPPLLSAVCL
jgi:hypothetical protein